MSEVLVAANYPDDIREIGDRIAALTPAEARELNDYMEATYNITPPPKPEIPDPYQDMEEEPECNAFEVVLKISWNEQVRRGRVALKNCGADLTCLMFIVHIVEECGVEIEVWVRLYAIPYLVGCCYF